MKKLLGFLLAAFLLASTASAGEWSWLGQSAIWTAGNVITNRQSEKEATKRAEVYAGVEHHRIEADREVRNNQIAADVLTSGASGMASANGGTVTSRSNSNPDPNRGTSAKGDYAIVRKK